MMGGLPDKVAIIAGAGTGKSTLLRKLALAESKRRVLYLTFTESNAYEFAECIRREFGTIPANVTIMTWYSFLLVHGVRPFPLKTIPERIDSCVLPGGRVRQRRGVHKGDHDYYCPRRGEAYAARLSELMLTCDGQWGGEVFGRIKDAYPVILVDEAQDFAGADYDVIAKLMQSAEKALVVGDPRQATYRTNREALHRNFSSIFEFIEAKKLCKVDRDGLSVSYRCPEEVIALANSLYVGRYPEVASARPRTDTHRVFKLKKSKVLEYAATKKCIALTWNGSTVVPDGLPRINMGEAKGMNIPNVIIYPTGDMKQWLQGDRVDWAQETLAKFYVAITRASETVAFVID